VTERLGWSEASGRRFVAVYEMMSKTLNLSDFDGLTIDAASLSDRRPVDPGGGAGGERAASWPIRRSADPGIPPGNDAATGPVSPSYSSSARGFR
jgi:hypothetical protein